MARLAHLAQIAVLLPCLAFVDRSAQAQSFDCAKAATPVEHAVCDDENLRELDSSLAVEIKAALARAPEQRQAVLADERLWLRARDRNCVTSSKEANTICLDEAYRSRILFVQTHFIGTPTKAALASCQQIADKYRAIADAHLGEPPLLALSKSASSGVTLAEPVAELNGAPSELREWGSKQQPAILFPDELIPAWISSNTTVAKLPGENLYRLNRVEGTAHCSQSIFFFVDKGVAKKAAGPTGFGDEESGSCGTKQSFGSIDQTPAFFDEDYDWSGRMHSTITVATWRTARLADTCSATFYFQPQFSDQTLNNWRELKASETACPDAECNALHRAAFELVAAVQDGPRGAQLDALAALTPTQRAEYDAAIGATPDAEQIADPLADPTAVLDDQPLQLPYVHEGHVYVASFGHFTIGWRSFADWNVGFQLVKDGTLQPKRAFAIGMSKAKLEDVELTH